MNPLAPTEHDRTDPELISRVRGGDIAAYGELFSRHVESANRLARLLVGDPDADDLVSEAFVKVLNVLLAGGGPDVAFRAYLLTAVRRLHVDKVRSARRVTPAGDLTPWDPGVPFTDTAVAGFEGGAAAKAFASLPERWQMVLWHLEVEKQKPADIAPLLGMSANSVSALAYRAREGLRQAFLSMHCGDLVSEACRDTGALLGAYVRGGLSRRDTAKVEDHLGHCRRCSAVHLELTEVNSSLSGILAPALLGVAGAAYLTASGAVGTGAAGLGTAALAVLGRARDYVLANVVSVAGGVGTATAAAVAGATAVVVVQQAPAETAPADTSPAPSARAAGATDPSAPLDLTALGGVFLQRSTNAAQAGDTEGTDATPVATAASDFAALTVIAATGGSLDPAPGTGLPSAIPTDLPTDLPTGLPSGVPTDVPTETTPDPGTPDSPGPGDGPDRGQGSGGNQGGGPSGPPTTRPDTVPGPSRPTPVPPAQPTRPTPPDRPDKPTQPAKPRPPKPAKPTKPAPPSPGPSTPDRDDDRGHDRGGREDRDDRGQGGRRG